MAAAQSRFVCQACGAEHRKWVGRCETCGEWNSVAEEAAPKYTPGGLKGKHKGRKLAFESLVGVSDPPPRLATCITELDRVFGGGLVPGSALLLGGDPGIGKSTIALQAAARLSKAGARCVYLSGEEAMDQVRLRARRLGLEHAPLDLAAATNVRDIVTSLSEQRADLVIVDSIQTMYLDSLDSAPGTVSQVRGAGQELIRHAKETGTILLLVGHVTKEGQIAGPKVLEHMVDTVLYFEGERGHQFRILRAVKNRFGPTDEIGVFEMTDHGLDEVPNPSALFLDRRDADVAGTVVFAGIEGSRPMLMEIQALVAPSALGTPRRAVVGWDSARLAMVLAVLDTRCGLAMSGNDVYLNVAGGFSIREPAADLAVAAALISSLAQRPLPHDGIVFGEVGLAGEIRPVSQAKARITEAAKLGFRQAIVPVLRSGKSVGHDMKARAMGELGSLVDLIFGNDGRR
ncbi:MAG: DNA repair protein RadA [Rhodospirillaceae bacterium]|nr:DNA repair protein RadA [Rhodospirillaceae bacterium]|tara:strand:- start:4745 stop:6121 length:1377 start_codon:yes stop_codon:yes gene_type:complete